MLKFEDVLQAYSQNMWRIHNDFLHSISYQLESKGALSVKQFNAAMAIFRKDPLLYNTLGYTKNDWQQFCEDPKYSFDIYQNPDIRREVRYLGNNLLAFRYKNRYEISSNTAAVFAMYQVLQDFDYKVTVVYVAKSNLDLVQKIIHDEEFSFDDNIVNFFFELENSENTINITTDYEDNIEIEYDGNLLLNTFIDRINLSEE